MRRHWQQTPERTWTGRSTTASSTFSRTPPAPPKVDHHQPCPQYKRRPAAKSPATPNRRRWQPGAKSTGQK
eukprot:1459435-Pyramimonas_sp.AAC.1